MTSTSTRSSTPVSALRYRSTERFDWITEAVGTFYDGGDFPIDDSIDLTTGGRLWLGESGNWALNFALRTDLLQLDQIDEHCPLGGLLGLTFFPRFREVAPRRPRRLGARARAARGSAPTPPPPPPPPPPAPAPPERMEVTCDFTPGSARLSNICKAKLDEVALRMKQDSDSNTQVIGYADGFERHAVGQPAGRRTARRGGEELPRDAARD